jgi:translation elongation factor EF-1alpha
MTIDTSHVEATFLILITCYGEFNSGFSNYEQIREHELIPRI